MSINLHTPKCFANHMGLWAIIPEEGQAMLSAVQGGLLAARAPSGSGSLEAFTFNSIRVINVEGMMMKAESKFGGTSTVALRQEIRQANRDESIKGIALMIDSPGGHVSGMEALVNDVASSAKPLRSYISDLGGSAAYWLAAATSEISTNSMAMVGSIGVYAVLQDVSKALDQEGVKLHVVSSGGVKGLGADGVVSQELIDEVQKRIDYSNEVFGSAVQAGRGMTDEELASVHNGKVFNGPEALSLKLVDYIESADSFIARFSEDLGRAPNRAAASLAIAKRKV